MDAQFTIRTNTSAFETLSAEDFETASIRSAAPSYVSDAPSYHSTVPNSEVIPAYSPPANAASTSNPRTANDASGPSSTPNATTHVRANSLPSPVVSSIGQAQGLPPMPPVRRHSDIPELSFFRIPSWSNVNSNPSARLYRSVANRRVSAASNSSNLQGIKRVLDRIEEEERNRTRPLEDPYLVGEEAASRARRERLARENGDEILIRENQRWDFFLAQMKDSEERERSWKQFRREAAARPRSRFGRNLTNLWGH